MENKPNFWSVMPASVRYDNRLRPNAKILYSEITALSNKSGFCTATNEYFSELYNLSKTTVSQLISELSKHGYIKVEIIRNDNKAIEERRIFCAEEHAPFLYGGISKNKHTSIEKTQEPISKKCKENNTRNNNNNTPISPKGETREKAISDVFFNYAGDKPELLKALQDFEEHRKALRKPLTDKARQLLIKKLNKLAGNTERKIELLETAIECGWLTIYPPKVENRQAEEPQTTLIEESWCQYGR